MGAGNAEDLPGPALGDERAGVDEAVDAGADAGAAIGVAGSGKEPGAAAGTGGTLSATADFFLLRKNDDDFLCSICGA